MRNRCPLCVTLTSPPAKARFTRLKISRLNWVIETSMQVVYHNVRPVAYVMYIGRILWDKKHQRRSQMAAPLMLGAGCELAGGVSRAGQLLFQSGLGCCQPRRQQPEGRDRKSTRLNSSHRCI